MGDIVANTMVTLNGVAGRPETWQFDYVSDSMMQVVAESLGSSAGLLLGRRTYEEFAHYWPGADPNENPLAPVMNSMAKFVVSSTLTAADWINTHIVSGSDGLVELKELKAATHGTLSIIGSPTLVRSLTEAGMVDQLSLMVYPLVVDEGIRLFEGASQRSALELTECAELPNGVLHLTYVPAGPHEREARG
jgi:dihydrofolate reductase